jgi:hypothetical protein
MTLRSGPSRLLRGILTLRSRPSRLLRGILTLRSRPSRLLRASAVSRPAQISPSPFTASRSSLSSAMLRSILPRANSSTSSPCSIS